MYDGIYLAKQNTDDQNDGEEEDEGTGSSNHYQFRFTILAAISLNLRPSKMTDYCKVNLYNQTIQQIHIFFSAVYNIVLIYISVPNKFIFVDQGSIEIHIIVSLLIMKFIFPIK